MIKFKRVYETNRRDGYRILVDRLWPRGLSKKKARVDLWFREIAPSTKLRKWFAHDPKKWSEFRKRYLKELRSDPEVLGRLKRLIKKHSLITLLYGARDDKHNQAVVLAELLKKSS